MNMNLGIYPFCWILMRYSLNSTSNVRVMTYSRTSLPTKVYY